MSLPPCPQCRSEFTYADQMMMICPECGHEWNPEDKSDDDAPTVQDANGALIVDGDKVYIAKDLKLKGSSSVIKIGTKATVRRVLDKADHQLDCKVDGAGEIMITAKFVKKM